MVKMKKKLINQLNTGFQIIYKVSQANCWCRSCLKISKKLQRCSKCKVCFYCNDICQIRDWKKS